LLCTLVIGYVDHGLVFLNCLFSIRLSCSQKCGNEIMVFYFMLCLSALVGIKSKFKKKV